MSQSSVAAVHVDAPQISVTLHECVTITPLHEALVLAFTDCCPDSDCTVVVEPRLVTEEEMSRVDRPAVFESLIVARTLSNWSAENGSAVVQVANASSESISLPKG